MAKTTSPIHLDFEKGLIVLNSTFAKKVRMIGGSVKIYAQKCLQTPAE